MKILSPYKYSEGDHIIALLHDWTADGNLITKSVPAEIVSKVAKPFGYNIRLQEAISFRGHIPLPIDTRPANSYIIPDAQSGRDVIKLQEIFIREFDLSKDKISLRKELATFFSPLIFRTIKVVHTKPANQIEYINYYSPDGKVITIPDDRGISDSAGRLAYKVTHFYGFSAAPPDVQYEDPVTRGKDMHFTMNRFSEINFWDGLEWNDIEKNKIKAFRPERGQIICGSPPTLNSDQAPSYDRWFICSPQLRFLINVVCSGPPAQMTETDIIDHLVLPENTENKYIPHEIPVSRYLYVAIYLLAIREVTTLPSAWNLPMRKSSKSSELEPFEVWWPAKFG